MKLKSMWGANRTRPPYKLLSLLLQYPDGSLAAAQDELANAVAALPRGSHRDSVTAFWRGWCEHTAIERAQQYVATFDLHKGVSLYLTFFLHGDTRKRGMALLRLKRLYAAAGFPLEGRELPDFLPAVLEFASLAPAGYGELLLEEHRPELELLRNRLREQHSPYALLIDAVCIGLRAVTPDELVRLRTVAADGPPREMVGLEPFAPPEIMPGMGARP
jgi:nitrate reductase delta subunit